MSVNTAKKVGVVTVSPGDQGEHHHQVGETLLLLHLLVCLPGTVAGVGWKCDITQPDTDIVVKDTDCGGVAVTSRETESEVGVTDYASAAIYNNLGTLNWFDQWILVDYFFLNRF